MTAKKIFGWKINGLKVWMKKYFLKTLLLYFCNNHTSLLGQDAEAIYQVITMDSMTIQASQDDLDVKKFIDWMIKDQSFYTAFKNLRSAGYTFKNKILILDKKQKLSASYTSLGHQHYTHPCRTMGESEKVISGDFFDRHGDYQYYTSKLYDRLFFTHGTVCVDSTSNASSELSRMEKNVQELKKLMFSPGSKADIPLLGNKTAIFEKQMQPYYDYRIMADSANGRSCFLFEIEVKPMYQEDKEHKTVVKKLQTWFDQDHRQIVKRVYHLVGQTLAYSFDVTMRVDVSSVGDQFFPSIIQYDGSWKVLGKRRENAKFTVEFYNFKP